MAETRDIRSPQFLDEKRASATATPVSFARISGRPAPSLRVVTPPPPRPPPTPPPSTPPPPPAPAPSPAASAPPEGVAHRALDEASTVSSAVLAGVLGPLPSAPGPVAAESGRRLEAAIERLRLEAARLADQARADALEIGFQVARRILEQELSANPEALFSLVRSAVRRLGDARHLVIRLHPADAERIDAPEGRQRVGLSLMQVEVVADPTLEPGDCVVESEQAAVDGRVKTRLEELRRAAERALEEGDS
ncbi:MAG: FliH/SctL family protein [Myxococcota bacterium]